MISILQELRDQQLAIWPMAKENYEKLGQCRRKLFKLDSLEGAFQFNPGRIVSTGAKIDKDSIGSRPCFLCRSNRPTEQMWDEIIPGWEFLVNPFPIFPLHFTIAASRHIPQDHIPAEMVEIAERLRGMCVFFNGARAGASAPDHLHCQAVMKSELPLINYLEAGGDVESLPFKVIYDIITPDNEGLNKLKILLHTQGYDAENGEKDFRLLNAYFWIGNNGLLRVCVIPRGRHRPLCYPSDAEEANMDGTYIISPGAIDMAGIVILPREDDFKKITVEDLQKIYSETALPK